MITFDDKIYNEFVTSWLNGINNEVLFWENFIKNKGGEWPDAFDRRISKAPSCQLVRYFDGKWPLKILDVGAGPISNVGINTSAGNVNITACDALAGVYNKILSKYNIEPYVRTDFAIVERLTDIYSEECFDIVNMENALDHSFDPFIGIAEMLRVAKTGGLVTLLHAENEAERENYNGFHQWNISEENSRLVIWRNVHKYFVDEVFSGYALVSASREKVGKLWLIRAVLTKTASPPKQVTPLLNAYDKVILDYIFAHCIDSQSLHLEHGESISELRLKYETILNSKSWKITKPIRLLFDLIKQIRFARLS